MLVEPINYKNVMALVVNDYFCATILENGEIEIVRKGDRKDQRDFGTILALENEYIDKSNELLELEDEISKRKANSIIIIIQGVVSAYLLALSTFVFTGISSIISLIGKFFLGVISASSLGVAISNIKKNRKNKKELLHLQKKIHKLSTELGEFSLLKESIFIPTRESGDNLDKCQKNIRESAELIHILLDNYVASHTGKKIVKYEEIYLDSDILDNEDIKIKVPMGNDEFGKAKAIVQDCMERKNVMDFLNERFMFAGEGKKEKSHVLKKKFPF